MPKVEWLINHESYFPDLGKLENIKYVVGYLPKTGWAAVDIRKKLFPSAKLVLINHVCQEQNCLLVKDEFSEFEQEMLQMASHADMVFSIGPHLYGHFKSAYRAVVQGRKLYDIPHKEILPKPRQQCFDNERPETEIEIDAPNILTYGQLNTEEALKRCDSIAASIGSAANTHRDLGNKPIKWKIYGVSEQAYKATKNFLVEKLQSGHVMPKPYKQYSADSLLQSLQQSDLCLPPSCYTDYSFEGLEAMAAGLPTTVQDDSHIAAMIERHFEEHKDYCVVRNETDKLTSKINENLTKNSVAVQNAKWLKEDLAKSEAVTESLAKFASSLTDEDGKTDMKEKRQEKEMAQVNEPTRTTTNGFNTTETKELLHHKSVNNDNDKDRKEATEVQPGMPVTEDVGTMGTTAVKGKETSENAAVKTEIQRREQVGSINTQTPSSSQSIETRLTNDSTGLVVSVELNGEPFQQKMKDLDEQEPTSRVRDEKEKVNTAWEECKGDFDKNANKVIVDEESQHIVCCHCNEHFGQVQVETTKISSLAIHLDLPTVYNLYRLEHTCLSGSFPDSFEPLLITDKMREEADKVGLQLKLKATYEQARFNELELFFINRDGGGLKPVKVMMM
ncbi:uncharacterized protein [Ptychodera flava]|uniref:uncharacterized protein n=1 Tax=Ptychodera flava TaxID=63121 RepID=UPI00396AA054